MMKERRNTIGAVAMTCAMGVMLMTSAAFGAFSHVLTGPVLLSDDFEDGTLDTNKWSTWTRNTSTTNPTFTETGGAAEAAFTCTATFQMAEFQSKTAYDIYEQPVEFAFSQELSSSFTYYPTRNWIINQNPGLASSADGFIIYFCRYLDDGGWKSYVKLSWFENNRGGSEHVLYDSGHVSGMGSVSYSLVLDGDQYAFYWHYGTDGVSSGDLVSSGTHGITQTMGSSLYLGFGLDSNGKSSGDLYSSTHDALVATTPEPATLGLLAAGGLLGVLRRRR